MSDAIEFVAEHIMRFERKRCQGVYGGGNISTDNCEVWSWCDWCGRKISLGTAGRCPRYPFPRFSMRDLMARLGSAGHHTTIRFDPQRDQHSFTVCLDGRCICDTDDPLDALCGHLAAVLEEAESDLDRDIIITECRSVLAEAGKEA